MVEERGVNVKPNGAPRGWRGVRGAGGARRPAPPGRGPARPPAPPAPGLRPGPRWKVAFLAGRPRGHARAAVGGRPGQRHGCCRAGRAVTPAGRGIRPRGVAAPGAAGRPPLRGLRHAARARSAGTGVGFGVSKGAEPLWPGVPGAGQAPGPGARGRSAPQAAQGSGQRPGGAGGGAPRKRCRSRDSAPAVPGAARPASGAGVGTAPRRCRGRRAPQAVQASGQRPGGGAWGARGRRGPAVDADRRAEAFAPWAARPTHRAAGECFGLTPWAWAAAGACGAATDSVQW